MGSFSTFISFLISFMVSIDSTGEFLTSCSESEVIGSDFTTGREISVFSFGDFFLIFANTANAEDFGSLGSDSLSDIAVLALFFANIAIAELFLSVSEWSDSDLMVFTDLVLIFSGVSSSESLSV